VDQEWLEYGSILSSQEWNWDVCSFACAHWEWLGLGAVHIGVVGMYVALPVLSRSSWCLCSYTCAVQE
jgi:hypothetical protein